MGEYRNRTTGEIKSQGDLRKENPNMSLPRAWNDNVHDALNVDPVFVTSAPTEGVGQYQHAMRNGVAQAANGNWEYAWQIVDMFVDIEGGQTKAEQEAAYQTSLDNDAAKNNRSNRDTLLAETDWWAVSDRTMTSNQTAYRKALRDITTHSNWPHLEDADWPTRPE
tara:strand:- start:294 stop:791 length:498 start_codon:yes stop_codon:yes gene_type:complete